MMHLPNKSVPSLKTDVESMSSLNNINVQNVVLTWTLDCPLDLEHNAVFSNVSTFDVSTCDSQFDKTAKQ